MITGSAMLDSRRNISLACALSALAGYVDAIGFLHLGGLFVSFMSGNSTRMGVSLAEGQWTSAATSLGLGVAGGSVAAGRCRGLLWIRVLQRCGCRHRVGDGDGERGVPDRWRSRSRPHLCDRRAGESRPACRNSADRRRALGLGVEPAALGG